MLNKKERESNEARNLFSDPKFARKAWRAVGIALLNNPAVVPIVTVDKDGNYTYDSNVQQYAYDALKQDVDDMTRKNRCPTELEMILACQVLRARNDTSAAVFVRDTLGAKPVDESKIDQTVTSIYETMSDDELSLLSEHRERKTAERIASIAQQQQEKQEAERRAILQRAATSVPLDTEQVQVGLPSRLQLELEQEEERVAQSVRHSAAVALAQSAAPQTAPIVDGTPDVQDVQDTAGGEL